MIKIIKSLSLSLSYSVPLSLSLSQHLRPTHPPTLTSLTQADPSPKQPIHIFDPRLRPVLHLNAHPTPNHAPPIHVSNLTPLLRPDHCFGFPPIRPMPPPSPPSQRSLNVDQTIALVFRRSDPSTSDPLLFRRSNPHQHCPPH